uniref:Cyclosome subunit 8 n=1 Tax=Sinocyclocheilus rhinocerous TaxID=307959 RepID=A0A673LGY3_9TELE
KYYKTSVIYVFVTVFLEFGDLVQIKKQLISIIAQCKERGLVHSVKWASELAFSLDALPLNEIPPAPELTEVNCFFMICFILSPDIDQALYLFNELREQDPFRIENMDTFSNLLYVRSMKPELSYLAHNLVEIDKYRVETCCVIGNYYSLRSQHEKAALYFQRALKLNPRCLGAWTLMGHEYMEMKNTSAAIQAYRHAIEVNKRDYRAWYGLGQTYEILKMPFYSLYYYRKAHHLRPNDSRMLVALGECYEKLSQQVEAKKCYWRAYSVGDVERMALLKLAKLHEQLNESDDAAQCYIIYIQDIFSCGEQLEHAEVSTALRYLGQYYFKNKLYDEASLCAQRCCDYNDAREEGKALLRQISAVREQGEPSSTDLSLPCVFNPLINTTTPVRRASPLHLSSVTP